MTTNWQEYLRNGVTAVADFPARLPVEKGAVESVSRQYPMLINAHYLDLIQSPDDALWRQVVPDIRELDDDNYTDDPLAEAAQSPTPGIIHRYPDRVIFLVSSRCPILCRFCMRKRLAGMATALTDQEIAGALAYIGTHPSIREVILSGGDPLMLDDLMLDDLLSRIRAIAHVEILRIHSRVPTALPQRVTDRLIAVLKKYHPLFLNIHCNHPDEISPEMADACNRLADAGLPLGSQTVLLKDINDSADVMRQLMRRLLRLRVKPYYLHHPDLVRGTALFRVSIDRGLAIMKSLYGHLPGSAVPRYMIDLPGGGGKVPFVPGYVVRREGEKLIVSSYNGKQYIYSAGA